MIANSAKRRMTRGERADMLGFFAFASPWLLGFLCLTLIPMAASLYISFTSWNLMTSPTWVGIANIKEVFADPLFYQALKVTFTYAFIAVPLNITISLFISLLLNNKLRGMNLFRTIFYMPAVVSGVVVAIVWLWVFQPEFGIINNLLKLIGIQGPKWVYDEHWAMPSMIIMSLWNVGGSIVMYLAALQNVSTELYEASMIDGAGWWRKLFHITLPSISPILLFTVITGFINAMQTFSQAFIMTGGGPNNATLFYAYYVYNNAFRWHKMGIAATLAWIMFILIFVLTMIIIRASGGFVHYENEGGA